MKELSRFFSFPFILSLLFWKLTKSHNVRRSSRRTCKICAAYYELEAYYQFSNAGFDITDHKDYVDSPATEVYSMVMCTYCGETTMHERIAIRNYAEQDDCNVLRCSECMNEIETPRSFY